MKATATAHPNLAFIKYWGRKDEILRLPCNSSISMNLASLETKTTVEFESRFIKDEVVIDKESRFDEAIRVAQHLDRIRDLAKISLKAKVVSQNNFPSGTGLSSSSSGFAALTVAGAAAAGLKLSEKELSILARRGSGSACRSIPSGIVEWLDGNKSEDSYAFSIFSKDYWDIVDVVAVVSTEKKEVSTSDGQKLVRTSPFFEKRLERMKDKIINIKKYIREKNFQNFGELIESEALEMHAIMITSSPSLIYWSEGTLKLMKLVKKWREEGLSVYFTVNTGQDIHLICQKKDSKKVVEKLEKENYVKKLIVSIPGKGASLSSEHLF